MRTFYAELRQWQGTTYARKRVPVQARDEWAASTEAEWKNNGWHCVAVWFINPDQEKAA